MCLIYELVQSPTLPFLFRVVDEMNVLILCCVQYLPTEFCHVGTACIRMFMSNIRLKLFVFPKKIIKITEHCHRKERFVTVDKMKTSFTYTTQNHMQPNERAVIVFSRRFTAKTREFRDITNDTHPNTKQRTEKKIFLSPCVYSFCRL